MTDKVVDYQHDIARDVNKSLYDRCVVGIAKYGPDFQGDVVQHLWEESLDTTFYAGRLRQEYGIPIGYINGVQFRSTHTVLTGIHDTRLNSLVDQLDQLLRGKGYKLSKIVIDGNG